MSVFDSKIFNGEVFKGYIDRIPNPNKTELIKSRAIRPRPDLASAMKDQDGGNYITTTLKGLINSADAQNYDGGTDMIPNSTCTFRHSRVVVGRMASWIENDFSYDITGGQDFIENIAEQIAEYWDEVDQSTIVHILNGVFNMTDVEGAKFVSAHTTDVTGATNAEGVLGNMDGTTLNSGIQKACGDNKGKFSLAIMHSTVATNLENLKLLSYLKYTDAQGIERDLAIATLNGKTVLVDDTMPVEHVEATDGSDAVSETKGVYTLTVSAAAKEGDKIAVTFGSKVMTYEADGDTTAANVAKTLKRILGGIAEFTDVFTVDGSGATVTFTQKVGGTGAAPTVAVTNAESGTLAAAVATTTAGVAAAAAVTASGAYTKYTTYVLGDGAIEYTDCGAKVPYEVDRDPKTNGGQDTLYSRQRKCFAPYGISFTQAAMATLSPTNAELENGANWELVNSAVEGAGRQYIAHKTIPIARIISRG